MKTRETFEEIRKRSNRFSLRVRLTLLVSAELVFCVIAGLIIATVLEKYLIKYDSKLLLLFELLIVSLLIGSVVTGILSRLFFNPIKKLREAMGKVADGDFSVRLEANSSSKEIQEIYSGFNLMAHELAATEILQTDFVSNVSHEFKTPINAIEGYATLLQDWDNLNQEQQKYVEKILFNTKRISDLVGNILLLSKIENQSIQTNQTSFLLDEQIRQSILGLEPAWAAKEVEFDVDLEKIEYTGNENLLRHVWDNIINNAIKFGPSFGLIKIRLRRQNGDIVFTVEDNGPGLTEETQKHLFDKFYQADSSHRQEGNGLGLALVKRIVSITGGEVSAQNIVGGGCKFTVKFKEN